MFHFGVFRTPMISLICFCVFSYYFFLSWNFLSASCMLTMSSNISMKFSLFAECLLSGFSCKLHWIPWYSLSLFFWSLDLGICFLYFPLNPILIYFWGRMVSIPFLSSHYSTWYCFCPWSMCNLVLANLQ
jgi:hypothetical protein